MISSSALFHKEQAEEVLEKARKTHEACQAFIKDLQTSGKEPTSPVQR
jgi:hypothetical protein